MIRKPTHHFQSCHLSTAQPRWEPQSAAFGHESPPPAVCPPLPRHGHLNHGEAKVYMHQGQQGTSEAQWMTAMSAMWRFETTKTCVRVRFVPAVSGDSLDLLRQRNSPWPIHPHRNGTVHTNSVEDWEDQCQPGAPVWSPAQGGTGRHKEVERSASICNTRSAPR